MASLIDKATYTFMLMIHIMNGILNMKRASFIETVYFAGKSKI